jgi:fructose-1,6-bisphosphatase/inositol monophosphatase family enzyme
MLIVREAGGTCDDRNGDSLGLTATSVAVSNAGIHREFLDVVRWRG